MSDALKEQLGARGSVAGDPPDPGIDTSAPAPSPTYHELPVVKAPPWIWYIPGYFAVGGLASGALVLAAAAQLDGRPELRPLVVRGRWTGTLATGLGSALLIADLGRPERFLHMLRILRLSSPLNVGTWLLTFAGMSGGLAAVLGPAPGTLRRLGDASGLAAGVAGAPLGTYTGVVLANTAMPLWSGAPRSLPVLFGASALVTAGAILVFALPAGPGRQVAARLGALGTGAELLASAALQRELGSDRVRAPLKSGAPGWGWRAAKVLGATSVLAHFSGRARLGAALGLVGAVAARFSIFYAGMRSAGDPRATFEVQRSHQS